MSTPLVPVAAVQLRAHDRDAFVERWPAIRARIADAAERARLVVVPEGTVPAYVIGDAPVEPHLVAAALEDVTRICARTGATVVLGGARPDARGTANAAYAVTAAGVTGWAEKCFLWHFDRRWFRAGETLAPIETPVGRLGVFICADGRIPTIAAALAARGAELLVVPTAWVTSGRDPAALENVQADLMAAVRARENGLALVAANKCGAELGAVLYCGKSQIVDADGRTAALAPPDRETTIVAPVRVAAAPRRGAPAPVRRGAGAELPETARIAFALETDDALRALARVADADVLVDAATVPDARDVALADDRAMEDPRALVGPRLDGVRLVVWRTPGDRWTERIARTRAAELRCFVIVLDGRAGRAYAVDPDGAVVAGTTGELRLAAFAYARARTEAWHVAPGTDVRAGLAAVADLAEAAR